ncbi:Fructokinase [Methylophaga frappieri]|uniref:Fructokinase n=1 Tax=Methylophaga frappieri (strain ATCC BAA-2434 / DSM 25690 / JAM7) TaxID=754477 RepID=I1YET1_METFJ|nr:Fructokinase [Methylophaga frappieri]
MFDCFQDQEKLGGAPFNVAWHLQALAEDPVFISCVGQDDRGDAIKEAMKNWQMRLEGMQTSADLPTGSVQVTLRGSEPFYEIKDHVAYDAISSAKLPVLQNDAIVYHGSLALRHAANQQSLAHLTQSAAVSIFVDINLREPWWNKQDLFRLLEKARWIKLNIAELQALGFNSADIAQDMQRMQSHFQAEHLIVTRGEQGVMVRCNDGELIEFSAGKVEQVADSVGAGDAFSAMYLHGLMQGWPVNRIVPKARDFAAAVVGLRGAVTEDRNFYQKFID